MVKGYSPVTLNEALQIRRDTPVTLFAGGTDLMAARRRGLGLAPQFTRPVLFLGRVPECRGIVEVDGRLRLGATVTLTGIQEDPRVPVLLRQAVSQMASTAVRNVATLGGNVGNASPAGDTLPPLHVLDAVVVLVSITASGLSEREVPLDEFITGPGRTQLRDDEIITAIMIPAGAPTSTWYRKVATRKAAALAKVSMAGTATVRDGILTGLRLAVGAAAPTVIRSRELEALAIGATKNDIGPVVSEMIEAYGRLVTPIDDQRSTAAYRRDVALRLIEHFVTVRAWRPDGEG